MAKTTNLDNLKDAETALFQLQFAIQMFNCGRVDTANECLANAQDALGAIINRESK